MFFGINRRRAASPPATLTSGVNGESDLQPLPVTGPAIFRNFCMTDFHPNESWHSLEQILHGNGGCFGLYGPRGSGKSWLMHRAIKEVEAEGGLGLWFPCPRRYNSSDFLLMLSDNLASAVERRLARSKAFTSAVTRIRNLVAITVAALLTFALIWHGADGLTAQGRGHCPLLLGLPCRGVRFSALRYG